MKAINTEYLRKEMKMKKLLITGAAFILVAGIGIMAAAAGPKVYNHES